MTVVQSCEAAKYTPYLPKLLQGFEIVIETVTKFIACDALTTYESSAAAAIMPGESNAISVYRVHWIFEGAQTRYHEVK